MDEEEIEKAVIAYLKKKGFKQTELAFQEEQQHHTKNSSSNSSSSTDPDIAKHLLSFSESDNVPAQYHDGYSKLSIYHICGDVEPLPLTYLVESVTLAPTRERMDWACPLPLWVKMQHELIRVLYPVFVHCFMDLVAKGHIQEARNFFNSFREDHEMMHLRDLQKLEGVLSPCHLEEMEFGHSLRQSKVNLKICQYSYELLL
ncbi:hypothetical protein ACSBR1_037340 [Camellia fascicularis]